MVETSGLGSCGLLHCDRPHRNLALHPLRPRSLGSTDRLPPGPCLEVSITNALTGFENGYVSPGKDAGVLVFSFQDAAFGGSSDPHVNSSKYLALTMGAFAKQFPSPPKFEQTPSGQSFITLDGANTQFFRYPGGLVEVGAGVRKDDGSVLVRIVYGPRSSFDTPASISSVLYSSLDLAL